MVDESLLVDEIDDEHGGVERGDDDEVVGNVHDQSRGCPIEQLSFCNGQVIIPIAVIRGKSNDGHEQQK